MKNIEQRIVELNIWLHDGYTDAADIGTIQRALYRLTSLLIEAQTLRATGALPVTPRRLLDWRWQVRFDNARGADEALADLRAFAEART